MSTSERSNRTRHTSIHECRGPSSPAFHAVDIIRTKRDGGELSDAQIDWLIAAYTAGVIADEQMSALAMAIVFRGLNGRELDRWTRAMINSGERLDFSSLASRPLTSTPLAAWVTRSPCRWRPWSPLAG